MQLQGEMRREATQVGIGDSAGQSAAKRRTASDAPFCGKVVRPIGAPYLPFLGI
jgi:hypothetical protein